MELDLANKLLQTLDFSEMLAGPTPRAADDGGSNCSPDLDEVCAAREALHMGVSRINASNNVISFVGPLHYFQALVEVDLSNNKISILRGDIWPTTLQRLDVSKNRLRHISFLLQMQCPELEWLNASDNELTSLGWGPYSEQRAKEFWEKKQKTKSSRNNEPHHLQFASPASQGETAGIEQLFFPPEQLLKETGPLLVVAPPPLLDVSNQSNNNNNNNNSSSSSTCSGRNNAVPSARTRLQQQAKEQRIPPSVFSLQVLQLSQNEHLDSLDGICLARNLVELYVDRCDIATANSFFGLCSTDSVLLLAGEADAQRNLAGFSTSPLSIAHRCKSRRHTTHPQPQKETNESSLDVTRRSSYCFFPKLEVVDISENPISADELLLIRETLGGQNQHVVAPNLDLKTHFLALGCEETFEAFRELARNQKLLEENNNHDEEEEEENLMVAYVQQRLQQQQQQQHQQLLSAPSDASTIHSEQSIPTADTSIVEEGEEVRQDAVEQEQVSKTTLLQELDNIKASLVAITHKDACNEQQDEEEVEERIAHGSWVAPVAARAIICGEDDDDEEQQEEQITRDDNEDLSETFASVSSDSSVNSQTQKVSPKQQQQHIQVLQGPAGTPPLVVASPVRIHQQMMMNRHVDPSTAAQPASRNLFSVSNTNQSYAQPKTATTAAVSSIKQEVAVHHAPTSTTSISSASTTSDEQIYLREQLMHFRARRLAMEEEKKMLERQLAKSRKESAETARCIVDLKKIKTGLNAEADSLKRQLVKTKREVQYAVANASTNISIVPATPAPTTITSNPSKQRTHSLRSVSVSREKQLHFSPAEQQAIQSVQQAASKRLQQAALESSIAFRKRERERNKNLKPEVVLGSLDPKAPGSSPIFKTRDGKEKYEKIIAPSSYRETLRREKLATSSIASTSQTFSKRSTPATSIDRQSAGTDVFVFDAESPATSHQRQQNESVSSSPASVISTTANDVKIASSSATTTTNRRILSLKMPNRQQAETAVVKPSQNDDSRDRVFTFQS